MHYTDTKHCAMEVLCPLQVVDMDELMVRMTSLIEACLVCQPALNLYG